VEDEAHALALDGLVVAVGDLDFDGRQVLGEQILRLQGFQRWLEQRTSRVERRVLVTL